MTFVLNHNRNLDDVNFALFMSDKELVDCITACKRARLNYTVITWAKPPSLVAIAGPRLRHDAEFIVLGCMGNELDIIKNINQDHPKR